MFENMRNKLVLALLSQSVKKDAVSLQRFTSLLYPGQPVYTDLTVRKATREGYKLSVAVYRAVRTIIDAASGIPWVVLDKDGEVISDHPLVKVFKKPNPEFSGQDLREFLIAHLKLVGNALWQPIIVNGQIKELWTVMPDLVRPVPADVKGEWLKGWQVNDADGRQQMLSPDTFIHFMEVDPGNPYWGASPLLAAARTVDTDNEAQDTQKISMQNRGIPSGVFSHESPMTPEQFEEADRRIQEKFLEKTRRRAPWVLGAGAKWEPMSLTPVEMDFIASRLQNKRDIASAFGIDPWFVGDREHSTYNNIIEARKALYENTVIPLLDDIESTLNLKIAPMYGDIYITYDTSNVTALREDFGKKVDQAKSLWGMGVPFDRINEKLELGFEEFPGWDTGYLPMMLLPTGSLPSEAEKMQTKALNLDTEEKKAIHWKRIDRRRVGWWGVVSKRVKSLYGTEAEAIEKAIKGKKPEQLVKATNEAISNLQPEWEKMMTAIVASLIEDFGNEIAEDLGGQPKSDKPTEAKWVFDPFKPSARRWIANHTAMSITTILDTDKADIKVIILKGVDENLNTAQIAKKIKGFYDDRSSYKAMRVARTEVASASGFGQHEAAVQSGVVKVKKWMSSRDDRVRDSHVDIDGEEKPLDEPYSNGLMFPGDSSGDPAEFIMCRCVEGYGTR